MGFAVGESPTIKERSQAVAAKQAARCVFEIAIDEDHQRWRCLDVVATGVGFLYVNGFVANVVGHRTLLQFARLASVRCDEN